MRSNSPRLASIGSAHLARLLGDWSGGQGALHAQLASRLHLLVKAGTLTSGARLPSERTLGMSLNVSRNTVASAFDQLRGEGVFESRQGDGTYVSSGRRNSLARGDGRLESFVIPAGMGPEVDLRSAALPGLPMVADELTAITGESIRSALVSHGYLPAGLPVLRLAVAKYYSDMGLPTIPEQVLVTSGAQQALRLAAESLVGPGSVVLIEEPSFRGAIETLRALGTRLIPVLSDGDGVSPAHLLEAATATRPSLIVLQSTVHNPTGSVLSNSRRRKVIEISTELGIPIIDDATPCDTLIEGEQPKPLAWYGGDVITVGSVSKSFWGGLRVGWLRADVDTVRGLASVKGGEDLGTSLVAQALAARLLSKIDDARQERREALELSRHEVLSAISLYLPDWSPMVPKGGASLWIRIPDRSATSFANQAEKVGVRLFPGPTFSSRDQLDDHIRVSFAGESDRTIAAIRTLAKLWRSA